MAEETESNSLEYTPTWIVASVCFIIVLISLSAERGLHHLGKWLKSKGQDALFEALQKIKEELMLLGFISLLLTVFQGSISHICIPEHLTTFMLPCNMEITSNADSHALTPSHFTTRHRRRLMSEGDSNHCAKGKAPLLSLEALHQLHIFIFVLAVVYVTFCASTVILGGMKVRRWKHWEDSMRRELLKAESGPSRISQIIERHHNEFFKQHGGYPTVVSWMISFFKQFYGSFTKSDYIALRLGFIMTHCPSHPLFDFHKYMMRTLEVDFKKVVGISWFLWAFVVLFLLLDLKGWHTYFWLSFLPLILLLLVGAKLEYIIASLAEEIQGKSKNGDDGQNNQENQEPWVKPSDKHFWFGRPGIVLYLIHFILFQNAFEIAFFFWVLFTYGSHSCILDRVGFIIPRLIIGLIVQVLCSYSTLPLYTIVTQMGNNFKKGIFEPMVHDLVETWLADARGRGHGRSGNTHHPPTALNRIEMHHLSPETRHIIPI